ncbi:MAG TPA: DNA recombination/repair protein RecA, partial [Lactobacillus sp.]|nr:DNA recombination/repair protein RecA [Lactobacillus sp.]
KNKVAPPFKVAIVDIMYGRGISQSGELVDMAVEKDIVEKSGSWYAYQGERIGQGREHAKAYLETHEEMRKKIEGQVREAYGMPLNQVIEVDDPDESARAS